MNTVFFASYLSVTLSLAQGQPLMDYFSETLSRRMDSVKGLHSQGEKSAAIVELQHITKEVPLFLNAYSLLAEYQLADGDRIAAIQTLKNALEKAAPSLKASFKRKIQILTKQFRFHDSYSEFYQSMKLLTEGDYEASILKLEAVLKKEPDHQEVLLRLGQGYFLKGELKKALVFLEKSTQMGADDFEAWNWLGRAYFLSGELKKSQQSYGHIRWSDSKVSELSVLWWSEVMQALKGKKAAIDLLEKDLEKNPKRVRILVKLAELRSSLSSKNNDVLWQAKKELQLALSRFDDYARRESAEDQETSFAINQLNPSLLKKQIKDSLSKLEDKLKKLDDSHP